MPAPELNKNAPIFNLESTSGKKINLEELKGKHVVLYFYPKDDTPGCTTESKDFRDNVEKFQKLNTIILGISRDSIESHEKFKCKYELPFDLLSDTSEKICEKYDVIKMKNMYGKQVRGIERSTFLIDKQGVLRNEWRKVKVEGHVNEILKAIARL